MENFDSFIQQDNTIQIDKEVDVSIDSMAERSQYLKFKKGNFDASNMKFFVKFNTKHDKDYSLKHYQYFSSNHNKIMNVKHYNMFNQISHGVPHLNYYPRFSEVRFQDELENKNENHYSTLFQNAQDNLSEVKIIQNKEYRGNYAKQMDYNFFKIQQSLEINQVV